MKPRPIISVLKGGKVARAVNITTALRDHILRTSAPSDKKVKVDPALN
jgi:hypothetical protein